MNNQALSLRLLRLLPPFWLDRLLEGGMILSLALYYIVGNTHLGPGPLFHVSSLLTLPFLLVFLVLCWYRLSLAVALLPLSLPFYLLQKTVFGHYSFSAAEIALWSCVAVALLQLAVRRSRWPYWLSWVELRARLGIFLLPMLVFLLAAAWSILIAYSRTLALRAFREEVLDPLVYLLLILCCLRTRRDLTRLLLALFGAGFVVALIGLVQYGEFLALAKGTTAALRINAVYGSANSVGLFFDYALPIGLALILMPRSPRSSWIASWGIRLLALLCCLPLLLVLYLTYSGGAWGAIICAALFLVACALQNRRLLLIGGLALLLCASLALLVFHARITSYLLDYHVNAQGISTLTKRIYLWESAWRMIRDNPITGYGLDNWLCHYSLNPVCHTPQLYHYWITTDPQTHQPTGLRNEPDLSHPHNILLHVWVSIGIFGLLAFIALVVLFFWLFFRVLRRLGRRTGAERDPLLFCMTLGVGSSMVAALVQGMVDSSFLEQDLAFCFWILVAALLLLRLLSKTPWRGALGPALSAENVG
jgi:putative inorganic carbon (HCO3(-)) transporter